MAQTKGKYEVKWHTRKIMAVVTGVTEEEEKATAQRIEKRLYKRVPVGNRIRKKHAPGKYYQTRSPGRLRRSIRLKRSKFKDGGYIVLVGGKIPFYAYWVEKGTIFTFRQKFGRKGEQYMKKSIELERRRFYSQMKKRFS